MLRLIASVVVALIFTVNAQACWHPLANLRDRVAERRNSVTVTAKTSQLATVRGGCNLKTGQCATTARTLLRVRVR